MHDGGLQVVDVDLVLHAGEAHLVGLAELEAALHAAAGHHDREAVGIVVAPEDLALGRAALAERRAAEFAAPDDERVLEQAAFLEVVDERHHRFVGRGHLGRQSVADVFLRAGAMEVPAPVEEVDEAYALLDEPTGEQAVVREAGLARLGAVGLERRGLLLRDIHDLGHAGLHAEGEFVLGDAGDGLGVAEFVLLALVEGVEGVERGATEVAGHARRVVGEQHGVALATALHALVDGRDEA